MRKKKKMLIYRIPESQIQLGKSLVILGVKQLEMLSYPVQECAYVERIWPFSKGMTILENVHFFSQGYNDWDEELFFSFLQRAKVDVSGKLWPEQLDGWQRVIIQTAFAYAHHAKYVVYKDATEGLTKQQKEWIAKELQILLEGQQVAVIWQTKQVEDVDLFASRVLWMHDEEIWLQVDKEELVNQFRIVSGTKQQFAYIEKNHPNVFLIKREELKEMVGLVRKTEKPLPIQLPSAVPTFTQLYKANEEYHKATKKYLFGDEAKPNEKKMRKYTRYNNDGWNKKIDENEKEENHTKYESPFD